MTIREEMANNNSEEGLNTISDTYENSCQNQPNMKSKNLYEYHESVFNTLALLSDPVWICSNEKNSIHLTAISEWVHHQRVWMAVNKVTVAEVVGGVRGVIPSSKLATYGDYRYDLDLEEMYDILEEQNTVNYKSARRHGDEENSNHPKAENKHLDAKSEETKDHVKNEKTVQDTQDLISHDLDDWILKWTTLLRAVRRVISQEKSFDVWTDVLMKTLNKFLSALRFNTSLLKLMQTDIPFITDYRQLLKEPVTTLEILSIPKPYLEGSFKLDSKQEDDLWLKLSSPSIKKLWGKNSANELQETLLSKDKTLGFDSWIGSTNFLRRQRQWKGSATTEESDDIEISEERGKEMIGSLINYIDGSTDKMERFDRKETSNIENKSKNYFPEMHKDWNRISFARRMDGVNEARANQTSNWKCYYNQQCEQQLLFKQVLSVPPPPPPMMFPPPLCIPPPPLLTTMHSFPTQKLPFYIPSSNQPLQNYNYEKLRLNLPRNHSNAWPLTSNIHQQTTIAMQNATFQSLAHTSHHTVPGNKYYNQSQITPQFQMGSTTVLQINQKYEVQDHILIRPTQFYQSTLTNMDRVTTLQNEKLIKEIRKNKILQNVTSQIPVTNKLPCLADSHQQNVEYFVQPIVRSTKPDSSVLQNTFLQYTLSKTLDFKQLLRESPEMKKATMMTESTHYKRAPLVIYNHQRSPITELRKEFSSALLPKSNMLYNSQQFPSKISKQNTFNNLEEIIKGDEKDLRLYTAKRSGHGIKKNEMNICNICKPPEQGHLKRTSFINFKDLQNILHQKRSKFLRYNDKNEYENKAIYSSQRTGEKRCLNDQTKQRKLLNNKEKRKIQYKRKLTRCQILLHLYSDIKKQNGILGVYATHKWIRDYIRLHKRDVCIASESTEVTDGSRYKFLKLFQDENSMKILESFYNFGLSSYEEHKLIKKNISKQSSKFKKNYNFGQNKNFSIFQKRNKPTICSQSQHSYDLNQLNFDYKVNNDGNSPGIPDVNSPVSNNQDRDAYAKFFNMIADSLLFSSDKVRATKMPNMKNEKIDGWTYFKIVIQIILRNATHVLLSENIQQINCSKTVNQFVAHLKNSQKH